MKAPAFQFYPADWQRDLSEHPLEIEGAWIRICCALWWSDTPGKATKPLTNWARVMRVGERKSLSIITYLLNQNIAEVDIQNQSITISSRRMLKDEYIRNIRRNAGSLGGNPTLKRDDNQPVLDKQNLVNQKPTPSSSSSSSKIKTIKQTIIFEDGKFKEIPPAIMEKWKQVAPGVNIQDQIHQAELWVISNPDKKRSKWTSFLSNWMVRAQRDYIKYGGNGNAGIRTNRSDPRDKNLQSREDAEVAAITARWEAAKKSASSNPGGNARDDDAPHFQGVGFG